MVRRYAEIVMVLALAAFAFLVTFNNITDYGSNFAFVQHVLSMDTTFPNNAAMYRAIATPALWHAAYWPIIAGEGVTFALFLIGAIAMFKARRAAGRRSTPRRVGQSPARRRGSWSGSSASWS